jgi:hypothetical protein
MKKFVPSKAVTHARDSRQRFIRSAFVELPWNPTIRLLGMFHALSFAVPELLRCASRRRDALEIDILAPPNRATADGGASAVFFVGGE